MTYERYERWTFWIFACCGFLPAMAPGAFLAIGAVLWPCVYIGIALASLFTDTPWMMVQEAWFPNFMFVMLAVTVFTLLVFGAEAMPAMLITYSAVWLFPGRLLLFGVAVGDTTQNLIAI